MKLVLNSYAHIVFDVQVLLEAGCNKKGAFVYVNDEWIVNMFYEGVLLNTCFIKEVILPSWKIWTANDQQIIQYVFKFCQHLLSPNHPHKKFNLKQIQSSELLESILLQIKVDFYEIYFCKIYILKTLVFLFLCSVNYCWKIQTKPL